MPTTNLNRKLLDLKRWEVCAPAPVSTAAGAPIISSNCHRQLQLFVQSATAVYLYDPFEDGWITLPNTNAPSIAAGASGVCSMWGGTVSVSAGGTTSMLCSITTSGVTSPQRSLAGYKIECITATNAANKGQVRTILSSGTGSSVQIVLETAMPAAISSGDTFRIYYPVFFVISGGSTTLKAYDYAANVWLNKATAPTGTATDSRMVATPSMIDGEFKSFVAGTATSGGAGTLTHSGKTWTSNQWTNFQLRITAGTGAGSIVTITSNTATELSFTSSVTTDNTTQYAIEGNNDHLYLINANATATIYRYIVSTNTWANGGASLASRSGNAGAGVTGHWIHTSGDSTWSNESSIIDGRRIYSFRGGATTTLDYFDIPSGTWTSSVVYAPNASSFSTGTKSVRIGKYIYLNGNASNYWQRFNVVTSEVDAVAYMHVAQGTAVVGDTAFDATYKDGATQISYIYILLNTSNQMFRMMVI